MSKGTSTSSAGQGEIVRIDEGIIKEQLGEMVRGTVEETLNAMLDAEAEAQLSQVGRTNSLSDNHNLPLCRTENLSDLHDFFTTTSPAGNKAGALFEDKRTEQDGSPAPTSPLFHRCSAGGRDKPRTLKTGWVPWAKRSLPMCRIFEHGQALLHSAWPVAPVTQGARPFALSTKWRGSAKRRGEGSRPGARRETRQQGCLQRRVAMLARQQQFLLVLDGFEGADHHLPGRIGADDVVEEAVFGRHIRR